MARLTVDWNVAFFRVPDPIRRSVERRLLALWRCLDCSRGTEEARGQARRRSEEFAIREERWTFTYLIDLDRSAAVVSRVAPLMAD